MHFLYNLTGESFLLERLRFILLSLRLKSTRCRPLATSFLQCWMRCASGGWVEQLNKRDTTKIVFCLMVSTSEEPPPLLFALHYTLFSRHILIHSSLHPIFTLRTITLHQPTFVISPRYLIIMFVPTFFH